LGRMHSLSTGGRGAILTRVLLLEHAMKVSARNVFRTVKTSPPGAVDSEVVMELAPGIQVVSIITKLSAEKLA